MAVSFIQRVGQAYIASGTPTSLTIPVSTAAAAGNNVLVGFWLAGGGTLTSVTDTKSNTYYLEKTTSVTGAYVYRANGITALTTSDSILITATSTDNAIFAVADLFSGLGTYDASASSTVGSANPGVLSVTARADDQLIYGFYIVSETGSGSYSVSGGSPFTETGTPLSTYSAGTNFNACILTAYDPSPSAGSISLSVVNPGSHSQGMT